MSRFALIVTVEFEPELKEEILLALLAHRERCLKDEPGTLQFEVLVPFDEPGKLMLFELYADAAAFAAHSEGSSLAQYRVEARPMITRVTSKKCSLGNDVSA